MKPSSPIIPGENLPETVYAKDQPEYLPLPVFRQHDGTVLSRWHCTWRERLRILITGDMYLWQLTFNRPLQPVSMETKVDLPGSNRWKSLWGRRKESGFWMASRPQWRLRFFNHDAFYLAMGRFRFRLMKPALLVGQAPQK